MFFQGSAKLEKAEILQMTVDHLKMLQATGGKGTAFALSVLFYTVKEHGNLSKHLFDKRL